jgi:hypothetical protein
VSNSCEQVNENSGDKTSDIFVKLSNCKLLKKVSAAALSYSVKNTVSNKVMAAINFLVLRR